MAPFSYKFPFIFFTIFYLIAVSLTAQQNPNFDNTLGLEIPESIPSNAPLGREVMVDEEGFENFQVGVDFAEPHISMNPMNPTEYFNAFNTNATHYTYNGYEWFSQTPNFGAVMRGDPVTAYDSLGNLYYENMFGSGNIEGCKVIVSTDNGATWSASVTAITGVDKNWIAADQTSGPYANYVYSTMTAGGGQGRFTRSTDFGVTWQNTFNANTQTLPGMMVAVGADVIGGDVPGGVVYVVTNSGATVTPTYTFYASTNGGSTFVLKSQQFFANFVGTLVNGRHSVENMRTRPYPFITADNSYGTHRGRLYLVYASNTPIGNGNKPDIFCRYSTDQGVTWSSAVVINDDPNTTNNHQWHPSIWCDKETGRLYAKWFDTRNTPTSDSAEVYASYSDDGGVTWAVNQNLSTSKFRINCSTCGGGGTPRYQGDYDAITSNEITSMAVWSDFRFGSFGSFVAYFPDFAMTIDETADTLRPIDTLDVLVNVPAVKLYDKTVEISAESIPSGNFTFEYPGGNTISSFPGSVMLRIISNNAAPDNYTIRVAGKGPNGTPVHVRDVDLLVTNPTTTVVQPNGGEVLYVGTAYPIKFEKIFIETIKLEFSNDGGSSWTDIGTTANEDEFIWIVPNNISSTCLIRVSDNNNSSVFDVSDAEFSIEEGPLPNWILQTTGLDSSIISIDIVDTLVAYAGTKNSKVIKTTDGGITWDVSFANQDGDVTSVFAVSNQKAYIIVNSPTFTRIRRTLSFGASWGTVYEDTSPDARLNAIHMFDEDKGFAVGNPVGGQWVLLKTSDGGANWTSAGTLAQNGSETGFINSMDWADDQTGWFGTNDGTIYKTTDGGSTWQSSTTTFTNVVTVSFTDDQNGIASGDATDRTTDGGMTWTAAPDQISGTVVAGSSVKGVNGRWYFVFGNEVLKTQNQGDNFSMDYSQANTFNGIDVELIQIDDNFWVTGYAVGEMGTIAKYVELLLATDVEEQEISIPESYTLKQNYPNPFNPSTTIEFSLPAASDVKLSVFNILGQQVATLLNEQRGAGNHSVVWNATDDYGTKLSSGIYFYKLNAFGIDGNEYADIRKMVLLK
ncbi:MAG: T9SS type A sorting domain-containing protein [Ignavibacteriaceae bacterium]|nr:T9SS type A sorting domain-containing protein [Ignavibacteria bacterium]NNL22486.1 T9SS type A sorting domain-containing protein [Ignavibacteriaceae bacterium]